MSLDERQLLFVVKMKDQLSKGMEKIGGAFGLSSNKAKALKKQLHGMTDTLRRNIAGYISANRGIKKMVSSLQELGSKGLANLQKIRKGINSVNSHLKSQLGYYRSMVQGFVLYKLLPIVTEFGDKMKEVQGVTGATANEMERMRGIAIDLGSTTKFTASNAVSGMVELGRAGFSTGEIMSSIKDTMQLAAAGGLALSDAAATTSNTLRTYRLTASEATRVTDVLASTASMSNTNIYALGESLKYVGATAAGFRISLEETNAALGVLANVGIKGSSAGTGLNAMLAQLSKMPAKFREALANSDTTVSEFRFKLQEEGIYSALKSIQDANINAGQANEYLGKQAGRTFNILYSNVDAIKEMEQALLESGGAAAGLATTMEDNLGGAMRRAAAAAESIFHILGQEEGGLLRNLVESISLSINYLVYGRKEVEKFSEEIRNLGWDVDGTLGKLKILGVAFEFLMSLKIPAFLALLTWGFYSLAIAIGTAWAALLGPVQLIIAAIAVVYVALFALSKIQIKTANGTTTLFSVIHSAFAGLWWLLKQLFKFIGVFFKFLGKAIWFFLKPLHEVSKFLWIMVFNTIRGLFRGFIAMITLVGASLVGSAQFIILTIFAMVNAVVKPIMALFSLLTGQFDKAANQIASIGTGFKNAGEVAGKSFAEGFQGATTVLQTDFLKAAAEGLKTVGEMAGEVSNRALKRAVYLHNKSFIDDIQKELEKDTEVQEEKMKQLAVLLEKYPKYYEDLKTLPQLKEALDAAGTGFLNQDIDIYGDLKAKIQAAIDSGNIEELRKLVLEFDELKKARDELIQKAAEADQVTTLETAGAAQDPLRFKGLTSLGPAQVEHWNKYRTLIRDAEREARKVGMTEERSKMIDMMAEMGVEDFQMYEKVLNDKLKRTGINVDLRNLTHDIVESIDWVSQQEQINAHTYVDALGVIQKMRNTTSLEFARQKNIEMSLNNKIIEQNKKLIQLGPGYTKQMAAELAVAEALAEVQKDKDKFATALDPVREAAIRAAAEAKYEQERSDRNKEAAIRSQIELQQIALQRRMLFYGHSQNIQTRERIGMLELQSQALSDMRDVTEDEVKAMKARVRLERATSLSEKLHELEKEIRIKRAILAIDDQLNMAERAFETEVIRFAIEMDIDLSKMTKDEMKLLQRFKESLQEDRNSQAKTRIDMGFLELETEMKINKLRRLGTLDAAKQIAVLEKRLELQQSGLAMTAADIELARKRAEETFKEEERLKTFAETWKQASKEYSRNLANTGERFAMAMTDFLTEATNGLTLFDNRSDFSMKEVVRNFAIAVAQIVTQIMLLAGVIMTLNLLSPGLGNALAKLLSYSGPGSNGYAGGRQAKNIASAQKDVQDRLDWQFDQTQRQPTELAKGGAFASGLVTSPTYFSYKSSIGNKLGLMGESGPEAVLPLVRNSQGRLGVAAEGQAQASQPSVMNFAPTITINYQGSGNRETDLQNAKEMGQLLNNAINKKFQELTRQQSRQSARLGG